jgi:vacuolar-type H+-ATPase subunit I/STV1
MRSLAGFILALIGGILGIIGGIWTMIRGFLVETFLGSMPTLPNAPEFQVPVFSRAFMILFIIFGIWMIIMGALSILASLKMNKQDNSQVKKGAIIALIVGIIAPINILTIIGAAIGLAQADKPEPGQPALGPPVRTTVEKPKK